jgi:hypothetical protein
MMNKYLTSLAQHFPTGGTMSRCLILLLLFASWTGQGLLRAADTDAELAILAGEYTAEFSFRTGQEPAKKEVLAALTLEIKADSWNQKFRGDLAPYKITLGHVNNSKTMLLTHQKVDAVRNFTYVLKDDSLTMSEQLGDDGEVAITVWKRKPKPAK